MNRTYQFSINIPLPKAPTEDHKIDRGHKLADTWIKKPQWLCENYMMWVQKHCHTRHGLRRRQARTRCYHEGATKAPNSSRWKYEKKLKKWMKQHTVFMCTQSQHACDDGSIMTLKVQAWHVFAMFSQIYHSIHCPMPHCIPFFCLTQHLILLQ